MQRAIYLFSFWAVLPLFALSISSNGKQSPIPSQESPQNAGTGQRRAAMLANREVRSLGKLPPNDDNPTTPDKVALGKRLFFDPILSHSNRLSCASCHQPEHGYADTKRLSVGDDGKTVSRNTPGDVILCA
jgi:cytochrome c peroxidase